MLTVRGLLHEICNGEHVKQKDERKSGYGISRELEKSGDLYAGNSGNSAGEVFHLVGELVVNAPRRFIHGDANQLLASSAF